jgi:hypothetical protein
MQFQNSTLEGPEVFREVTSLDILSKKWVEQWNCGIVIKG